MQSIDPRILTPSGIQQWLQQSLQTTPPFLFAAAPYRNVSVMLNEQELQDARIAYVKGPYAKIGDVQPHSPGVADNIRRSYQEFLRDFENESIRTSKIYLLKGWQPRVKQPVVNANFADKFPDWIDTDQAVIGKESSDRRGQWRIGRAAYAALIEKDRETKLKIKEILLRQAAEPGLQFDDRYRWPTTKAKDPVENPSGIGDRLADVGPSMFLASFQCTRLLAYQHTQWTEPGEQPVYSATEKAILDNWFLQYAIYCQKLTDWELSIVFPNRLADDYTKPRNSWAWELKNLKPTPRFFGDTKPCHTPHQFWNNRRLMRVTFYCWLGCYLGRQDLIDAAKRVYREFFKFTIDANGDSMEMERVVFEKVPSRGLAYALTSLGCIVAIAEAVAKTGDLSLYRYTTDEGILGTEGGSKNLKMTLQQLSRYYNGTIKRYATNNPAYAREGSLYAIDGTWQLDVPTFNSVHEETCLMCDHIMDDDQITAWFTRSQTCDPPFNPYKTRNNTTSNFALGDGSFGMHVNTYQLGLGKRGKPLSYSYPV